MTDRTADVVVIGGGVYGCATAYYLAMHGAKNVALFERGQLGGGGTGKSCAICRTHYSVRANMLHAVESLKIFTHFDQAVGGDCGWHRTGYLVLGPEEHRQPMEEVFRAQNEFGIDTATLSPAQARQVHPLLSLDDVAVIGYDSMAGFCDPHLTTMSYARRARELGVTIHAGTAVSRVTLDGGQKVVETAEGRVHTPVVVLAAGPWTNLIAGTMGLVFPYVVSRHKVITLRAGRDYQLDWPVVKDLTTPDKIYFRPETGGVVLVGTGDHGDPIADADTLTDRVDLDHAGRTGALIAHRMPSFENAEFTAGWTGPYDITDDWNPIVGPAPGADGVYVAVGFSGHGFKLAPTISEGLAQTVLGQSPRVPIDSYSLARFREGKALHGAYGIGSIS